MDDKELKLIQMDILFDVKLHVKTKTDFKSIKFPRVLYCYNLLSGAIEG